MTETLKPVTGSLNVFSRFERGSNLLPFYVPALCPLVGSPRVNRSARSLLPMITWARGHFRGLFPLCGTGLSPFNRLVLS